MVLRMVPVNATSAPQAKESPNRNSIESVPAIALSQNAEIASGPRCPLPSGSKPEGPIGSSTIPSGANSASQASLSRARTAACEARPAARAGCSSLLMSFLSTSVLVARSGDRVLDVLVGEFARPVLLRLDITVESDTGSQPGDHDGVGDAGVVLLLVAVAAELVHADRLDLERHVGTVLFGA